MDIRNLIHDQLNELRDRFGRGAQVTIYMDRMTARKVFDAPGLVYSDSRLSVVFNGERVKIKDMMHPGSVILEVRPPGPPASAMEVMYKQQNKSLAGMLNQQAAFWAGRFGVPYK